MNDVQVSSMVLLGSAQHAMELLTVFNSLRRTAAAAKNTPLTLFLVRRYLWLEYARWENRGTVAADGELRLAGSQKNEMATFAASAGDEMINSAQRATTER